MAGWIIFGIGQLAFYILIGLAIALSNKPNFNIAAWLITACFAAIASTIGILTIIIEFVVKLFC